MTVVLPMFPMLSCTNSGFVSHLGRSSASNGELSTPGLSNADGTPSTFDSQFQHVADLPPVHPQHQVSPSLHAHNLLHRANSGRSRPRPKHSLTLDGTNYHSAGGRLTRSGSLQPIALSSTRQRFHSIHANTFDTFDQQQDSAGFFSAPSHKAAFGEAAMGNPYATAPDGIQGIPITGSSVGSRGGIGPIRRHRSATPTVRPGSLPLHLSGSPGYHPYFSGGINGSGVAGSRTRRESQTSLSTSFADMDASAFSVPEAPDELLPSGLAMQSMIDASGGNATAYPGLLDMDGTGVMAVSQTAPLGHDGVPYGVDSSSSVNASTTAAAGSYLIDMDPIQHNHHSFELVPRGDMEPSRASLQLEESAAFAKHLEANGGMGEDSQVFGNLQHHSQTMEHEHEQVQV